MATTDCTLGCRFAESKFSANKDTFKPTEPLSSTPGPSFSPFLENISIDAHFAELMETLRIVIYEVMRLPFEVQTRGRLVRNYWEVDLLVKEMRLLLDPVVLDQLVQKRNQQRAAISP